MSIAATSAGACTPAPAGPSYCSSIVALDARVAAGPTVPDNSISTLAPFSGTVVPIDARVTPASADPLPYHSLSPVDREMDQNQMVNGLTLKQWDATFRPGIVEFAATTFIFTREASNLVRIAFGNSGPHTTQDGPREPVYTHAVMLPPEAAIELAGMLLKFYAEPKDQQSTTSAEL